MFQYRIALAAFALTAVTPANAVVTITTLYSTGVDAAGTATTGNGADLHWTLNETSAYTGASNGSFPINPWVSEDASSRWLTPTTNAADSFDPAADGIYFFNQTFSLEGIDATTATFAGRFLVDNSVDQILLNGTALAGSGGSFTTWTNFASTGGSFNAGINTLTFVVRNFASSNGNPTGLRVELSGSGEAIGAVPEASTWAMMIVGFGMIGFAARRRSSFVAA